MALSYEGAIAAALRKENGTRFSNPLGKDEVKKIAASVSKYPPEAERPDDAEKFASAVLDQQFGGGKHLLYAPDGHFWHYTGKFWERTQGRWIDGCILKSIQESPFRTTQRTAPLIGQVRTLLEARLAPQHDPLGFLADPPPVINCTNGEVWIQKDSTVKLRKHRPDSYLRHCLDIEFDPDAKCPEYDEALLGIFAKADDPKAMRRHWNELVGYLIQPRRNIPLILILLGSGDNGKTVLTKTLMKLIGQAQVQAQRVEELGKNRFAMGSLLGKLVFIDDDVQAGARLPDGILKMISEAKEVTGENKFKPAFNFVARAVPILLCNNIPSLPDVSHGMLRRLMVIPFNRTFTNEDKDPALFDRIWANELPGVLNRALAGYGRLLARGRFKDPEAMTAAKSSWLAQANPLPAFIEACCEIKPDAKCWMQDLYPAYQTWAKNAGYTLTQNQTSFRRNLEHLHYAVAHGNRGLRITGLCLRNQG